MKAKAAPVRKRSQALLSQNKFEEVRQYLSTYTKANPDNKYIWVEFALFEEQQFETDKALEYAEKALTLDPKYFDALVIKARSKMAENKTSEAMKIAKQAESINPASCAPLEIQANGYLTMQNYRQAAEIYKRLSKLDRYDTLYRHNLSLSLLKSGQLEEAEAVARDVVRAKLNPPFRGTQRLAEILLARGKLAEAESMARLAIKQMPDIVPGQKLLIKILRQEKKFDQANQEEKKMNQIQNDVNSDALLGKETK